MPKTKDYTIRQVFTQKEVVQLPEDALAISLEHIPASYDTPHMVKVTYLQPVKGKEVSKD